MAKSASERRYQKRVTALVDLVSQNPESFRLAWTRLMKGWLAEVRFRAHAQSLDAAEDPIPAIYGVLAQAEKMAQTIGVATDPLVADSLVHLKHVSAKAVAKVTNPKLYRFDMDCTARLRESYVKNRTRG